MLLTPPESGELHLRCLPFFARVRNMKASFHISDPHSERVTRIGRLHAAPARSTAASRLAPKNAPPGRFLNGASAHASSIHSTQNKSLTRRGNPYWSDFERVVAPAVPTLPHFRSQAFNHVPRLCLHLRSERVTRIELASTAWEAVVLPMNYTRVGI